MSLSLASVSETWGTTPEERRLEFPCDPLLPGAVALYRGVDVAAPPPIVFRWLCQLRVAPYSYDWIDNLGRESPRSLVPGLEDLAVGQDMMTIFTLVAFERDRHVTVRIKPGGLARSLFGDVAVSYVVVPVPPGSRLLAKILVRYPSGPVGALGSALLPWGDLVMMRRQLLNLKELSRKTARSAASSA